MTGTLRLVNTTFSPPHSTPQATLRSKRASAASAIAMRWARVSSRNASMRDCTAAARASSSTS